MIVLENKYYLYNKNTMYFKEFDYLILNSKQSSN